MSDMIAWIAAEAEQTGPEPDTGFPWRRRKDARTEEVPVQELPAHQFGACSSPPVAESAKDVEPSAEETQKVAQMVDACDEIREAYERERRIYRGRTVAMLRRYMRYSIETGRLPSLLGREFFRAKVTSYTVVTFEDRVIFVHDMEKCLERLDEFSRQLIARHVLQEHDQVATARLLHCTERTVRRLTPYALDQLSEILLKVGLLERVETNAGNCCQGGLKGQNPVSDCEDGENKF
jgi:hypothetical protein